MESNQLGKKLMASIALGSILACGSAATAASFSAIRIGDVDGFGFGDGTGPGSPAGGFKSASGVAVDVNGNGLLDDGDFLPSINGNGTVATGSGDDFDNRSGESLGGGGYTDTGTSGLEYTDIGLSRSYDSSSGAGAVFDANTGTFGAGGAFPSPPSNTLPNQPGFVFDFTVNKGDIVPGSTLFFNLVFGDYDVSPALIQLTLADSTTKNLALGVQPSNQDGLIQESSTELTFNEVFTDGGPVWNGSLGINFLAPNEPYTAFDYVELSLFSTPGSTVPEPGEWLLLGIGAFAGFVFFRRQRTGAPAGN